VEWSYGLFGLFLASAGTARRDVVRRPRTTARDPCSRRGNRRARSLAGQLVGHAPVPLLLPLGTPFGFPDLVGQFTNGLFVHGSSPEHAESRPERSPTELPTPQDPARLSASVRRTGRSAGPLRGPQAVRRRCRPSVPPAPAERTDRPAGRQPGGAPPPGSSPRPGAERRPGLARHGCPSGSGVGSRRVGTAPAAAAAVSAPR